MYTLGIDIGSTTSKCVILQDGSHMIAKSLRTGGSGTEGPSKALSDLWESSGLTQQQMDRTIVTGYGRSHYAGADGEVSELTCHALGGQFVFPGLRTIIDIGGQDVKAISLTGSGRMSSFVMNDKCAAGTGRFLDVMAGILQIPIDLMDRCAAQAESPASISSTCTVFAESEVISQLAAGTALPDLVVGICQSVAARTGALAKRIPVTPPVCMSGGVAKSSTIRHYLEQYLSVPIAYDPLAQYFGAIGAALWAQRELSKP